jgi:23S rRNA (cytidine1920-2'-O)/16S rRNA (cytidine1409-2'-O)-methyltransferase
MRKVRLDQLLVERGLCSDPKTAASWIMARKVRVGDRYITKAGTLVALDAPVDVVGLGRRYVSRGGEKLDAALKGFGLSVEDRVALDAGASTGGFTDCLLQHGAAMVYAVEVGFGQLRGSLAADPRVVVLERTNIAALNRDHFRQPLDLCVADLSYLSLSRSLPILRSLFHHSPLIVHLVKPLFEGVAGSEALDRRAIARMFPRLLEAASPCGLHLKDLMASPILGSNGTVEFFGLFSAESGAGVPPPELFERALNEAEQVAGGLTGGRR